MRIVLEGDRRIRVRAEGAGLEIEATDPHVHFSPLLLQALPPYG